ncbi:MAG: GNAT family protein [Patescibacteria group bacterium]
MSELFNLIKQLSDYGRSYIFMEFELKKFKKGDEKSLRKNINCWEISKNMLSIPYPYSAKDASDFLKKHLKIYKQKKPEYFGFKIEIDKEVAGSIGTGKINRKHNNTVIGFWLGKKYWNKGIMTKALRQFTQYLFREFKLKKIYAYTFIFNKASQRVLEKAGFKREGELKKHFKKGNRYYDVYVYAKIK